MDSVKILGEREGGLYDALVPTELINREDVPVDQNHVDELISSMHIEAGRGTGSGQLSPVLLGQVDGYDKFFIIDGFHRDAAMAQTGRPEVFATVRVGSSLEDIYDLRILTANTHTSVSFARINEWIQHTWSQVPLSERINPMQVFSMCMNGNSGSKLGLTPEEADQMKAWGMDKAEKWRMSPASIYNNLAVAEIADPELVKSARGRNSGRTLEFLTPQHLKVIAREYPNDYPMQRLAARICTTNNMNVPTTRAALAILGHARDYDEAVALAQGTDWSLVTPPATNGAKAGSKNGSHTDGESAAHSQLKSHDGTLAVRLLGTELRLGRSMLEALVLKGDYTVPGSPGMVPREIVVYVDEDADIQELSTPVDHTESINTLLDFADESQPKIVANLISRIGFDEHTALQTVQHATLRVSRDLERGDLRHLPRQKSEVMHGLLTDTIKDEVSRRRTMVGLGLPAQERRLAAITGIALQDVTRATRRLDEVLRRAFVLRGILEMTPDTTGSLLDRPPHAADAMFKDALAVVARITAERKGEPLHDEAL